MNPWATANPDWERQLLAGEPLLPDFPLLRDGGKHQQIAEMARGVFGMLKIPDVAGMPRMKDAGRPWFARIVEAILGSYDVDVNVRHIKELFLCVPKKNGKSSSGAALMMTAIIMNNRPEAEYLLIAPTKEIANISFKQARGIIRNDERLSGRFHIQTHTRMITQLHDGATLQIKAADTDTITGGKQLGTLIDETHVFAKRSNADDVFVELRGAMAARPDGFMLQITTQSKDPPTGVFKQELDMARAVRDGSIELPMLPVIYEMPEGMRERDEWKQRRFWPCLNPNLGLSVDLDFLSRELLKAERAGIEAMTLFASQHFNVEIGIGMKTDHWSGARHWAKNGDPAMTLDELISRSDVITVGIDGGGLDDLLGLAIIGRNVVSGQWMVRTHAWVHEDVPNERRKSEAPKFAELERAGDLTIVGYLDDAFDDLVAVIDRLNETGKLGKIGLDPFGVKVIVDKLDRIGIRVDDGRVEGVSQGYKLQGTIKAVEGLLGDGKLTHGAQALMDWSVGNCRVKVVGNSIMITKQASGTAKIDPVMALFIGAALMLDEPAENGPSIYNQLARADGFLVV